LAGTIFADVNPVDFDVNLTRILRVILQPKLRDATYFLIPQRHDLILRQSLILFRLG